MLICIEDVLSSDRLADCRALLAASNWEDGRASAGAQSASVKDNRQVAPERSHEGRRAQEIILRALSQKAQFLSAALPKTILPPMFNRYGVGQKFGVHVDNAIRVVPQTGEQMRADISATLFLSDPEDYDGGELIVETAFGSQEIKLRAGDMVLYPSSSLHQVAPITRGERTGCFFWVQSMIRNESQRGMLFDIDQSIQDLSRETAPASPSLVRLTGVYHNLIRAWGDV
jgi:PKHD-type hydroxylase